MSRPVAAVSVVIATLNGAATLPDQLDAIVAQCDEPLEIVVADNGSTDGTQDVVVAYAARHPEVQLVDASQQRGQCFARNVGAAFSTGALLLFLDQDDVVALGYVAAMSEALATHDIVGSRLDIVTLNPGWVSASRRPAQVSELGRALFFLPYAGGQTLGVRREAFERVGGFDPDMPGASEDVDLCWRVQLAGGTIGYVPDAVVRYRYRDSLLAQARQGWAYGRAEVALYERYRLAGMGRRSPAALARKWAVTGRLLARARSMGDVSAVTWRLAHDLAMLGAAARCKVPYF